VEDPSNPAKAQSDDNFRKAFNFCYETVRGLLIYAKEGKFDELFLKSDLTT